MIETIEQLRARRGPGTVILVRCKRHKPERPLVHVIEPNALVSAIATLNECEKRWEIRRERCECARIEWWTP